MKSVSPAGAFVALARNLEARVKMNNLADGYVDEPQQAFPEGQLVTGRIIGTDHNRCCSRTACAGKLQKDSPTMSRPQIFARFFVAYVFWHHAHAEAAWDCRPARIASCIVLN